jgi:hypothetical protein
MATLKARENLKLMKCLKCDKMIKTTIEHRICGVCKYAAENYMTIQDTRQIKGKLYGDMGIWEKKV